jgi:hypothetical protein
MKTFIKILIAVVAIAAAYAVQVIFTHASY